MAECGTISVITLACCLYSLLYVINIDGFAGNLNCRVLGSSLGVTVRMLCYPFAGWRFPPAVMSRLAILLVLLVAVLGAQGAQQKGKRKSGRRAVLSQQPVAGGENENNAFDYYEEYDTYDEYENGG